MVSETILISCSNTDFALAFMFFDFDFYDDKIIANFPPYKIVVDATLCTENIKLMPFIDVTFVRNDNFNENKNKN